MPRASGACAAHHAPDTTGTHGYTLSTEAVATTHLRQMAATGGRIVNWLVSLYRSWSKLRWTTRLCVLVWVIFGTFGFGRILTSLSAITAYTSSHEVAQRNGEWSPVYGFAHQCAPHLLANASVLLVDPTDGSPLGSGTSSPAQAAIDSSNTIAFMYALYPHAVTTMPSVAANWTAGHVAQDYVAIWAQRAFRSVSARDTAQAAGERISAGGSAILVCSYADAAGDRGALYAVSSRARGARAALASAAPQPPGSVTVMSLIRVLLGLICLWGIGFMLITLIMLLGRMRVRMPLAAFLGLPIGCIAISVEMLCLSLAGQTWSLTLLCAPWLVLACALLLAGCQPIGDFRHAIHPLQTLRRELRTMRVEEVVAGGVLALTIMVVVGTAAYHLPFSDGFNFYYFKAQAFYHDLSVAPYYRQSMNAQDLLFTIPAHPPLIPLTVTWLYLWIGGVNEHVSLLLWPALYVAALAMFFWTVRGVSARPVALWLTAAFAVCAFPFTTSALAGSFTDMPLGAFLLMGSALLWRRLSHSTSDSELIGAGVLLGALPLIKEEGLPLSILAAALFLWLYSWQPSTQRLRRLAHGMIWLGLPCLLTMVPGLVIKLVYAPVELLVGQRGLAAHSLISSIVVAWLGFTERAVYYWLPVVALLGIAVTRGFLSRHQARHQLRTVPRRTWFLVALVGMQCLVDVAAMAVNPVEVHTEIQVASVRLILQLTPLVMLASLDLWPMLTQWPPLSVSGPAAVGGAGPTRQHQATPEHARSTAGVD